MPDYQPFPIADFSAGQVTVREPWLTPQDAFEVMNNFSIERGRVVKRSGTIDFSRLETNATQQTDDGDGATKQFTGTIPGATTSTPIVPSTVSITDDTGTPQVVTDDGAGALIGDVDGGGTNTISYTTGAFDVTFAAAPPSGTDNVTIDARYYRGQAVVSIANRFDNAGLEELLAFDQDRLFVYNTGNGKFIDQLTADTFTGDDTNLFQTANFDTYIALTNNVDAPKKWDGTTLASLGVSSTSLTKAKLIFKYKGRLMYLNTVEGGTSFPRRARWSNVGAFETLTGSDNLNAEAPGVITSAGMAGDLLIVFFDNPPSTWALIHTGDPLAPFTFRQLEGSLGGAAVLGTVAHGGSLLTLGPTEFTGTNGASVEKANPLNPMFVQDTMNPGKLNLSTGILNQELEQAWFSYVAAGTADDTPDNVVVFGIDSGAMSVYDLPFHSYGKYTQQSSLTWATFDGTSGIIEDLGGEFGDDTWGAATAYTWNEPAQQSAFPLILGGTRTGYVRQLNVGTGDATDAGGTDPILALLRTKRLNPYIESMQLARLGHLDIKADTVSGGTLTIRLFAAYQDSPYQTSTMSLTGTDEKVNARIIVNIASEFHRIEIENNSTNPIQIDWINPYFSPTGQIRAVA